MVPDTGIPGVPFLPLESRHLPAPGLTQPPRTGPLHTQSANPLASSKNWQEHGSQPSARDLWPLCRCHVSGWPLKTAAGSGPALPNSSVSPHVKPLPCVKALPPRGFGPGPPCHSFAVLGCGLPNTSMSGSCGYHDWDSGSQWRQDECRLAKWRGHQWSGEEWGGQTEQWRWDQSRTPPGKKNKLRRVNTEEGKDYSNRTYLGGEERTSLTRDDRMKLVWAVLYVLEPEVDTMWRPQWIQRADLQVATGIQLDALIFLTSKFQPSTNLHGFKDLFPDTVRQAVREAYVSRQPTIEDRINLLDEISLYRDHLNIVVKWAEYNHFQPGADPKQGGPSLIKARAPRCPSPNSLEPRLGWLHRLPHTLAWVTELGQPEATAPGAQQLLACTAPAPGPREPDHALERRTTDEDHVNQVVAATHQCLQPLKKPSKSLQQSITTSQQDHKTHKPDGTGAGLCHQEGPHCPSPRRGGGAEPAGRAETARCPKHAGVQRPAPAAARAPASPAQAWRAMATSKPPPPLQTQQSLPGCSKRPPATWRCSLASPWQASTLEGCQQPHHRHHPLWPPPRTRSPCQSSRHWPHPCQLRCGPASNCWGSPQDTRGQIGRRGPRARASRGVPRKRRTRRKGRKRRKRRKGKKRSSGRKGGRGGRGRPGRGRANEAEETEGVERGTADPATEEVEDCGAAGMGAAAGDDVEAAS